MNLYFLSEIKIFRKGTPRGVAPTEIRMLIFFTLRPLREIKVSRKMETAAYYEGSEKLQNSYC